MSASLIHFIDKNVIKTEEFLSSGSFIVPKGVQTVIVELCGGGGSGGGGANGVDATSNSGGGGAGGYSSIVLASHPRAVVPGETLTVTVGAGGAVVGQNTDGNAGGASSVVAGTSGWTITVPGGPGGLKGILNATGVAPTATQNPVTGTGYVLLGGGYGGDAGDSGTALPQVSAIAGASYPLFNYTGGAAGSFAGGSALAGGNGGGGAAGPYGNGAAGGDAPPNGNPGNAGSNASANSGAGGGGGSGGGEAGNQSGGNGGAGGSGRVIIYYANPG